nr:immunoglobulin light chain junction region [Macaca mulatta]
CLHGYGSPYSF